ncbi:MAG: PIN domain-containing protein [Micrococcales bacterium]|nr:PIN domain-containing protein [Micrococcales bacterium]
MIAFDADVLIYATQVGHPLGDVIAALFDHDTDTSPIIGSGSTLLIPETLTRPTRRDEVDEVDALLSFLARLDLIPLDAQTATLAACLGAKYGLKAPDSVHIASAVAAGADRFLTNNHRDFPKDITEITIINPDDLHE